MFFGLPRKPFAIKTRRTRIGVRSAECLVASWWRGPPKGRALKFWYTNCFYCRRLRETFGPDSHPQSGSKMNHQKKRETRATSSQLLISDCSHLLHHRASRRMGGAVRYDAVQWTWPTGNGGWWSGSGPEGRRQQGTECQELSAASGGRWSLVHEKSCRSKP